VIAKSLGLIGISLALSAGPTQAATIFSFNTGSPSNTGSISRTESGITLSVNNPVTSYTGGGVNTNSDGLCTWLQNSASADILGKRCGYTDLPSAQSASLTGLSFNFDKSVFLKSFNFTSFAGSDTSSLTFTQGVNTQTFNLSRTDSVPKAQLFSPDFLVAANTPLFLTSSGTLFGLSGEQRINSLSVEEVPGPIPALSVLAAFSYAKKLRKKTQI
jgi:hypothetical protein